MHLQMCNKWSAPKFRLRAYVESWLVQNGINKSKVSFQGISDLLRFPGIRGSIGS